MADRELVTENFEMGTHHIGNRIDLADTDRVNETLLPRPDTRRRQDVSQSHNILDEPGHTEKPPALGIIPLFRINYGDAYPRKYEVLQQWEGIVDCLSDGIVKARILNLSHPKMPEEIVEIPMGQFSDPDFPLLKSGAVFYWSIGNTVSKGGQRQLISEIRLRRLPKWTATDIENALSAGEKLLESIEKNVRHNST